MAEAEVTIIGGGWLRVTWPDQPGVRLLALTAEKNGRRVVDQLVIRGADRVDSATLKSIPIGWLEGVINIDQNARALAAEAESSTRLDLALAEVELLVDEMTAKRTTAAPKSGSKREPLQRPTGTDPNFFYRQVAEAYNDVLRTTSVIAPVLAEEAGVPVATVRRWIQEARRRGFLPPARQGRAG
ncbi:hypothetical protein ABZT16_23775 [Streptomyces flaveolus]|uniref:hypothetical protein n=1 Tax=Streptomyces flaveolus TaxID=67297 RepID=UPI0033BC3020